MMGSETTAAPPEPFFSNPGMLPSSYGALRTPMRVWCGGNGTFAVHFGEASAEFTLWTDRRGLEIIAGTVLAALVRADISGGSERPPVGSDPFDLPF